MPPRKLVDHADATDLSVQLQAILRAQILAGELVPDALLPAERELQEIHKLARGTVRRALVMLADENLIVALPRRGWRVVRPQP
jgi:GntR family transcriptional regulator